MIVKSLLFANLILFTLSLEEPQNLKETMPIYKALSELSPPFQQEVCRYENKKNNNEIIYLKSCKDGYRCSYEAYDDDDIKIYKCIPYFYPQKYGETCNYDIECAVGHCDLSKKKCAFSKDDKPLSVDNYYRCGSGLIYVEKSNGNSQNKGCQDKGDYLEKYCRYTKKGDEGETRIYPIKPFYVCGESGIATEKDNPELKPDTIYTKVSKIGTVKNGVLTESEYACKSGGVSPSQEYSEKYNLWHCDKIKSIIGQGINDDGISYVTYNFEYSKEVNATEEDGYFYYNYIKGEMEPYNVNYENAFNDYLNAINKYQDDCKPNTHDYYFSPFDCGIKQIRNAYYYTMDNMYLYKVNDDKTKMIRDYLLNEESVGKKYGSSSILSSKTSILGLIVFLFFF